MSNKLIGAKVPEEEANIFKDFCKARGENVSSTLRRLILTEFGKYSFLSRDRKRALGFLREGGDDEKRN